MITRRQFAGLRRRSGPRRSSAAWFAHIGRVMARIRQQGCNSVGFAKLVRKCETDGRVPVVRFAGPPPRNEELTFSAVGAMSAMRRARR